jgi:hypothetical protein
MLADAEILGIIRLMKVKILLNGIEIKSDNWDHTELIMLPEDYYCLNWPKYKDKKIRVIDKEVWDEYNKRTAIQQSITSR